MDGFDPGAWAGANVATEGEKRQDISWFNLKDGENGDLRILTPNPKQMWVHRIVVNGKRYPAVCLGLKECPAPHEKGKNATPRYAFVVIDRRDKVVKIWEMNSRTFKALQSLVTKKDENGKLIYGDPTGYDLSVNRVGSKTDTQYLLIPGVKSLMLDAEKALAQPNLDDYYKPNRERMEVLLRGEVPKRKEAEGQESGGEDVG